MENLDDQIRILKATRKDYRGMLYRIYFSRSSMYFQMVRKNMRTGLCAYIMDRYCTSLDILGDHKADYMCKIPMECESIYEIKRTMRVRIAWMSKTIKHLEILTK